MHLKKGDTVKIVKHRLAEIHKDKVFVCSTDEKPWDNDLDGNFVVINGFGLPDGLAFFTEFLEPVNLPPPDEKVVDIRAYRPINKSKR